jgi:hypothetical protein
MGGQGGNRPRKPARDRQVAVAKPNPFDDIARQVNADEEANDRAAGLAVPLHPGHHL